MFPSVLLFGSIATLSLAVGSSSVTGDAQKVFSYSPFSFSESCGEIAETISAASAVFYDGSPEYAKDIYHHLKSVTEHAACSFEPGTVEDVGIALRILGRTRTPFAVKGGGHTGNPGFSSSPGVQIAMSRFSEVVYDPLTETAKVGAGLVWDEVYCALEPYGRIVVGGRLAGVGVAGYTLGGGYSWHTNQYGLAIDNVEAFELVLPNGTAIDVTESSSPDLFFALKGGGNNFGIVTRFTLKTYPGTQIWGGTVFYRAPSLDQVVKATANFAKNEDPKASIMMTYNYGVSPFGLLWLFYDAPGQPIGVFDEYLAIPGESTVSVQSLCSLVRSMISKGDGDRGLFAAVSTPIVSLSFVEAVLSESEHWGERFNGSVAIQYSVQPFLSTHLAHNTTPTAYPPDRSRPFSPFSLHAAWLSSEYDGAVHDAITASASALQEYGVQLDLEGGGSGTPNAVYSNYALFDTPLVDMFGDNLPRLQAIHAEVDPQNVMGLAGGFKF